MFLISVWFKSHPQQATIFFNNEADAEANLNSLHISKVDKTSIKITDDYGHVFSIDGNDWEYAVKTDVDKEDSLRIAMANKDAQVKSMMPDDGQAKLLAAISAADIAAANQN